MAGKISNFFREYIFIISIILTIVGLLILIDGAIGIWYPDTMKDLYGVDDEFVKWSTYFLIVGFIIFAFGVWYLYSYLKNKKFILEEIETNKRSEFLKKHGELKIAVKGMPKKYRKMLKDKEEELKVK